MKKITAVFVIFTLIFCFASCSKTKQYKKIGETPTLAGNSPSTEEIGEDVTESTGEEKTDEESTDEGESQNVSSTPITTRKPSPSTALPSTTKPATLKPTTAPTEKASESTTSEPPTTAIRPTETTTLEKFDETETVSNVPESNSAENEE